MTPFEIYSLRSIKKNTTWLTFLFLGWSYGSMEQMGKQFLYYVTFGGLGMWTLYRLFTLNGAINDFNYNVAKETGMSGSDMAKMGLVIHKRPESFDPTNIVVYVLFAFVCIGMVYDQYDRKQKQKRQKQLIDEFDQSQKNISNVYSDDTFVTKLTQERDISAEKIIEIRKMETTRATQQRIVAEHRLLVDEIMKSNIKRTGSILLDSIKENGLKTYD